MFFQKIISRSFLTSSALCRDISAAPLSKLEGVAKSQKESMLSEHCILVDEQDRITGSATKLDSHIYDPTLQTSPLHRAFSVFLFNTKGELLLQQRSKDKTTFPGYFTNSCCSHPLSVAGELGGAGGVVAAARRRLQYELGIDQQQVPAKEFQYLTRILYSGRVPGSSFAEHEVDYILFLQKDVVVLPNPDEVQHFEYVSRRDIHDYLETLRLEQVPLTPWFSLIMRHYLTKWWDNLDNLHQFVDHHNIHRL